MEIEPTVLLAYAIIWTIFYAILSRHIAELSRQKWTTWVQSEESDDILVEALQAVIEEIEDRMHDKLEDFKSSFFGSLGAASKKLDQATGQSTIKALTKDNPVMGFVADYMMKRGGLDALQGQSTGDLPKQQTGKTDKLGLK
tara:strand:+ start:757 stop:1182 length:426 start_codon:yes stop_codon:yes gene_type:complete